MSRQKRNNIFKNLFRPPQKSSKVKGRGINKLLHNWLMRLVRSLLALIALPKSLLKTITKFTRESKFRLLTLGKANSKSPKVEGFRGQIPMANSSRGRLRFLMLGRGRIAANRGFVLPTIAILLLIMSLVVSSLLYRSLNRTTQVIGERNQQVIYNAATPAIDRAKAKIEFLFRQDPRFPGGLPSDKDLEEILQNIKLDKQDIDPNVAGIQNPYDLPGETRIDINGDGVLDNAWSFKLDTNGDGNLETIAYSVLTKTLDDRGTPANKTDDTDRTALDSVKAPKQVIRNGPINLIKSSSPTCQDLFAAPEAGWDQINTALVRRAFQVTALVLGNNNQGSRTIATLEMQQDRQAERGNKWGAWFRNDLEIFPGPAFRWNGSMHTEGNLIIGGDQVNTYMISAPNSCLYKRENAEITIGDKSSDPDPGYQGQIISGTIRDNNFAASSISRHDIFGNNGPSLNFDLRASKDSVNDAVAGTPANISLDPVVLFTTNKNQGRNGDPHNTTVRDTLWKDQPAVKEGRIFNRSARAPYIDDTYRADNRYGPKPEYNDRIDPFYSDKDKTIPKGNRSGDLISTTDPDYTTLINLSVLDPNEDNDNQGLDGYWERRAWADGLRVIVGQRLELGNAFGWQVPRDYDYNGNTFGANESDPLNVSPAGVTPTHEQRQWRTLRDNLAAVQSSVVYHEANPAFTDTNDKRNFPIACLATTAHPGTRQTVTNSTIFTGLTIGGTPNPNRVNTDFLTGNGTNGWEFNPPATNPTAFANSIASTQPMGRALRNLAAFSGDPFGAFPARQDSRDGSNGNDAVASVGPVVHPFPNLTAWGDYSNLRRALQRLDGGIAYDDLSLADKTTLQTASCTLGMLAYNIDNLQDLNYASTTATDTINQAALIALDTALQGDLDGAGPQAAGAGLPANSTPDTYVNALPAANQTVADLVHLKEQVARDRRFGFGFNIVPVATTYTLNSSYALPRVTDFQFRGVRFDWNPTAAQSETNFLYLDFDHSTPFRNEEKFLGAAGTNGVIDNVAEEQEFIRRARSGVKYIIRFQENDNEPGVTSFRSSVPNRRDLLNYVDRLAAIPFANPPVNIRVLTLDFDPVANNYLGAGEANNLIDSAQEEREFIRRARNANPQYVVQQVNDFDYGGVSYDRNPHDSYDFPTAPPPAPSRNTDDYTNTIETNIVRLGFNPISNNYFGFGLPTDAASEQRFIRLATTLGPRLSWEPNLLVNPVAPWPARPANMGGGTGWPATSTNWPSGNLRLDPRINQFRLPEPKFPSLHYLFPVVDRNQVGTATPIASTTVTNLLGAAPNPPVLPLTATTANLTHTVPQNSQESYIAATYMFNGVDGVNDNVIYRVLQDGNVNGIEDRTENGIDAIALQPRTRGEWQLPNSTANMGNRVNTITDRVAGANQQVGLGFLDKGIFNGREMMSVRVLDFDLDLLRRTEIGTTEPERQSWLPDSGVIYAFREDAVREDAIARPTGATATWANCDTANEIANAACQMNAIVANSADPPINPNTGISPKAVDFYADPDRRPHGFRLRRGIDLRRTGGTLPPDYALRGMSFISDNPVYIMGDNLGFNLHRVGVAPDNVNLNNQGTLIEEFNQLLDVNTWNNFYTRTTLNPNFARLGDAWRPVEIIADAVSILSQNFVDGSIAEGILRTNNGNRSSYRTLNAPGRLGNVTDATNRSWVREDGSASNNITDTVPIKISRFGYPIYCVTVAGADSGNLANPNSCSRVGGTQVREQQFGRESDAVATLPVNFNGQANAAANRPYIPFSQGGPDNDENQKPRIQAAANTFINATIVSGLVPSRPGQSYGGLHNFPRFLESWGGNLNISGAFVQLNFSTSATAPFDHDSWEPGAAPNAGSEPINYYSPPARRWGYDVGLQYAPAGPVARRFITPSNTRSEFYRELPLDDPYVVNLRCARVGGNRIDPKATTSTCP
jgi:hypothetical protein